MTNSYELPRAAAAELLKRRQARKSLLAFISFCWWKRTPFLVGTHTRAVCEAIDQAIEKYEAGESAFLNIAIPFRHGKSDIVSRALPPYFLGRCFDHEPDVIMSGYGSTLVEGFSKDAKKLIRSERYRKLFPKVKIQAGSDTSADWALEQSQGRITAAGLEGALTGKGGNLIILDDYCKSRLEAESLTYRERTWNSFTNDLLSRRAPNSIVIVCATPWHTDDVRGRIKKHMKSDEDFPQFQEIKFSAKSENGYLFPERFSEKWYRSQYATQGKNAAALLDCEPVLKGGNRFNLAGIRRIKAEDFPSGRYVRCWDLASSKKERDKDDPDYTVGVLGLVQKFRDPATGATLERLYIRDVVYLRGEAPERNRKIKETAERDGPGVPVCVESFGAYKDAAAELREALRGNRIVTELRPPGDKSAKASPLEPIFDGGNVFMPEGAPWIDFWARHFEEFPAGEHDDAVDATALVWHESSKPKGGLAIG